VSSLVRQLRIAARVLLIKHEALVSAAVKVGLASGPSPEEGGAARACPAPPLPHEHARLRAMLLRMLSSGRGAA
jgi:hypothetical protein